MKLEKVFSVSEFLDYLNAIFSAEENFFVSGEVSGFKKLPSGIYFSIKDKADGSLMECYMNPFSYRSLGIVVEDGMEVKVGGIPNVYKPKGRLNFRVETIEPLGEGSLKKAYDALKKKLESEGLFGRKRRLPEFISRVGVITSRTGAVIHDFRKNLLPIGLNIFFVDTRVEGLQAVAGIVRAIRYFNKKMPDLEILVLIRGGGSLEDMQAFNNEIVARELFASKIPTISGIGHDKDIPIASLVSDMETSTPSIAATTINSSWDRLYLGLPRAESELLRAFEELLADKRAGIKIIAEKLINDIGKIFSRADALSERLLSLFETTLRDAKESVKEHAKYLTGVNPERNLKLGYSIILSGDTRKVIKSVNDISEGDGLINRVYQGWFTSKVENITKSNK